MRLKNQTRQLERALLLFPWVSSAVSLGGVRGRCAACGGGPSQVEGAYSVASDGAARHPLTWQTGRCLDVASSAVASGGRRVLEGRHLAYP